MIIGNRFETHVTYPLHPDKVRRGWLVQKAYDRQSGRDVILKSVPAAAAPETRELEHEDDALQRVRSLYVVSSFGMFSAPHPAAPGQARAYLVVELFSEDSVQKLIERHGGRLGADRALRITAHLLEAFELLNRAGVIHRDLHPKHLSYRDRNHFKLYDLGMALSGPAPTGGLFERLLGTASPSLVNAHPYGTRETMAPEEFDVHTRITPAANVYSAGALLYRMLVGRYPLAGDDLYRRPPVSYPAGMDPRIRACLHGALANAPQDRYGSPRELREDLGQVLQGK